MTRTHLTTLLLPLALTACNSAADSDTEPPAPPTPCEQLGLSEIAFDDSTEGVDPAGRRDLAPQFTIPLADGSEFSFRDSWIGCDVTVILPHDLRISQLNADSIFTTSVADLVAASPRNARYIFMVRNTSVIEPHVSDIQAGVDAALAGLSEDDAAWWKDRLIVSSESNLQVRNWLGRIMDDRVANAGLAIDRFQKVRGVGSMASVEDFNSQLQQAGAWPWEARLKSAAKEVVHLNFEAERQAALDAVDAVEVVLWDKSLQEEFADTEVQLPSAADMATYDTLEIDVLMECPDATRSEQGNCGAWDYLAYLWLFEEGSEDRIEMARFITTYHRESRWVVDASQALPWLANGGTRTMRYEWAPPWNTQPTDITVKLRFSNQGKGMRPVATLPLWTGGALNADYNNNHPPVTASIPAGAKKVELRAITTGHGAATNNCAEFCNHQHTFSLGGTELLQEFPEASSGSNACQDDPATVPNQGGTWWFGRGGWCPGREVIPWDRDVTELVTPGQDVTVSYSAQVNGRPTNGDYGNVRLSSWLVVYE